MLLDLAPTLVGQVLIGLGISWVTYQGMDVSLDYLKNQFLGYATGAPASVLGLFSLLKVGTDVSMIASALAVRMTISGLQAGGSISNWIKKK